MADLANESHWYLVKSDSANMASYPLASQLPKFRFSPLFNRQYFKIFVSSNTAKPSWFFGGWLSLWIGSVESPVPTLAAGKKTFLDEWLLVDFPMLENQEKLTSAEWHLLYEPPHWFKSVSFEVLQYEDFV